jgi:N-acylneuraminate cytidylyltransferase
MSIMPPERCFEIDEPVDLEIAEAMLKKQLADSSVFLAEGSDAGGSPDARCLMPGARPPAAVLFDFDGVFTNNKVYVDEAGKETVRCDRSDGWGLAQLKKSGIKIAVLSTEVNPVVTARCKKLGLECRQGLGEKKFEAFMNWCAENKMKPAEVIFIGNDANDIQCLEVAGCGVVPADAYPEAVQVADKILSRNGGEGAVRELCEMVMGK